MTKISKAVRRTASDHFENSRDVETFSLECDGAVVNISTDHPSLPSVLKEHLPSFKLNPAAADSSADISLITRGGAQANGLYSNGETALKFDVFDESLTEFIADKILMILAKVSLPAKIYLHGGGIVWNGLSILIPGTSYAGKTMLIKEFIEAGAEFYSDDCIILDADGNMLPFPRDLAVRTESGRIFRNAAHFGAQTGTDKIKVALILFAQFSAGAVWKPEVISPGASVLRLMDNFYYRPSISDAPQEIFRILTALTSRAEIYAGERGEAGQVLEWVGEKFKNG